MRSSSDSAMKESSCAFFSAEQRSGFLGPQVGPRFSCMYSLLDVTLMVGTTMVKEPFETLETKCVKFLKT